MYQLQNPFIAKLIRFHFLEEVFNIYGSIKVKAYRSILFHTGSYINTKAVARRYSAKKLFLKISQNLQENTCAGVSLVKLPQFICNKVVDKSATLFTKSLPQVFCCGFWCFLLLHFKINGSRICNAIQSATSLKKRLLQWCFPVNLSKFSRT